MARDRKTVNKAAKNNPERFPEEYIFQLSPTEKKELGENFDQFENLKHSPVNPKAFAEKGLYMLATILKSKQATMTTLMVIETFAKISTIKKNRE